MTKSELIETLIDQQSHLPVKDVELAVKAMLEHMSEALANGERIEIRGFGSFSLHYRAPRIRRNPKTGESVEYGHIQDVNDIPQLLRDQIEHFFENYKTLEKGKWVKVEGWANADEARKALVEGVEAYNAQ